MRPRIVVARLILEIGKMLSRLGEFICSLTIMVMKPEDLVEFGRQSYATPDNLRYWSTDEMLGQGFSEVETVLLEKLPLKTGRVLLLGMGGGRDAICLAQMGFAVTGVDFVPEMVQQAIASAAQKGLHIEGLVQEISELEVPPASYDLVWLSCIMYSSPPTRARRIKLLRRLKQALRPEGYFICTFVWLEPKAVSALAAFVRKIFAWLTRGNLSYEPGDRLWQKEEFMHSFSSEADLRSEFEAGDFTVLHLVTPGPGSNPDYEGGALLVSRK
jgi:SAM-dependent methyltransferase